MVQQPGNTPKAKAPERRKLDQRWSSLKVERSSFLAHWSDISRILLPFQGRFFVQDHNRGQRRANKIYDATGTRALRILGAGMMAGATSPARPWFRLKTADEDLNDYHSSKVWLSAVARIMQTIFQKSNTYRSLHQIYEELGGFGTGAAIVLPDFQSVVHNYTLTAGEYCIATDYQGRVCTLYREFERPVSEVVKEFGLENCSNTVKNMYLAGNLDAWVPMIHAIEPRADRDVRKKDNKNMAWGSYYFETGVNEGKFLRESGFPYFPALVPRWAVSGGDIYGNSPGMEALGAIEQLQHEQLRKGQGIDYKTKPPVQAPTSLKNSPIDMLPGGVTYYDASSPQGGVKNLFESQIDLGDLREDIQDVRVRINNAFYADLFLMLANATDTRMTATEVAERHEEKLLMLGPVLERLHDELLNPLIEITFSRMVAAGIVPPPPPELRGMELNVDFISMLAQAQKAIGANSVDRWMGNLGAIAQWKPEVMDKVDIDYYVEAYGDMLGVDPKMIAPDEKVAAIRQERAKQIQQAQQAEMAEKQSKAISNLGGASMGSDSVLGNVMDNLTGYNTPGVLK